MHGLTHGHAPEVHAGAVPDPRRPYGHQHRLERAELLEAEPWCTWCGSPSTVADHVPPVALHDHRVDGCWCVLVASCKPCSDRQGAEVRELRRGGHAELEPPVAEEVEGIAASSPLWRVPWLLDLLEVPGDAGWPRFMSAPHPAAVGSLGQLVEDSAARYGVDMRWWQRLALRRLLEVDELGELVWAEAILTDPRRVGKSWLLRELGWWRLTEGAALFGEPQTILHTSRTLSTTLDVAKPAMHRADDLKAAGEPFSVLRTTGREHIVHGRNEWLLRSEAAAYGLGPGLAFCDESWDYAPETVAEGIQPSLMERASPQLLLVSTAHRRATDLIPNRRQAALAELDQPSRRLLLEWSAPVGPDLLASARAASPVWSRARERLVANALDDARQAPHRPGHVAPVDMFVSQYVNDWSAGHQQGRSKGEPLVEFVDWQGAAQPARPVAPVAVLAVEDYYGREYGVGWATVDGDGRIGVTGRLVASPEELGALLAELEPEAVLAGVSIVGDPVFTGWAAEPVGQRETPAALALVRRLVAGERLWHDDELELGRQVADLRVVPKLTGLALVAGQRSDLVRTVAWCVAALERRQLLGDIVW